MSSNIESTKDGLVEKSSGRKIESPLDITEAHTEQAKELIRAGKLDANDPRAAIYVEDTEQPGTM